MRPFWTLVHVKEQAHTTIHAQVASAFLQGKALLNWPLADRDPTSSQREIQAVHLNSGVYM